MRISFISIITFFIISLEKVNTLTCESNCLECVDDNTCLKCRDGFYITLGKCFCDLTFPTSPCKTCASDKVKCTSCGPGFVLDKYGVCNCYPSSTNVGCKVC